MYDLWKSSAVIGLILPSGPRTTYIVALRHRLIEMKASGFPGGAVVENPPANAGDTGSSPGLGGSHMPRSN